MSKGLPKSHLYKLRYKKIAPDMVRNTFIKNSFTGCIRLPGAFILLCWYWLIHSKIIVYTTFNFTVNVSLLRLLFR